MQPCDIRPLNLIDYRGRDSNIERAKQYLDDDREVFWLLSYALDEVFKKPYPEHYAAAFRNPHFLIALLSDEGIIDRKQSEVMEKNCGCWVSYWIR